MKKTMNINIAGQLFRIDEDAYEILTRYLEHVSARFRSEQGGEETISDIETRIAEIFGGGNEPPTLVSKEMVSDMINIMGAPEDYYDEAAVGNSLSRRISYTRKSMYDPNSASAKLGKALSDFFRAFGRFISGVIRVFAVIFGALFTVIGFVMLFSFVLLLFFHNAPILSNVMEPEITNLHTLLSIVLNSTMVLPVIILASIVILLPLGALVYLGIRMIFNIRERSKIFNLVMFVVWIASACALGVFLSLQLSVYSNNERVTEKIMLENPPDTLYIEPAKKVSSIYYEEYARIDDFSVYRQSSTGKIFASVDLHIHGSDTTSGWISVDKRASSNSDSEAWVNARAIEYNWKLSGDTLYVDEFFALPEGNKWNGSTVDIDISLPEGSVIKFRKDMKTENLGFWGYNRNARVFRINGWNADEIEE